MKLKRPRCEYCGKKVYPKNKSLRESGILLEEFPSYCPDCGKEISNAKKAQLDEYNTFNFFTWCLGFIIFMVIVFITVTSLRNA